CDSGESASPMIEVLPHSSSVPPPLLEPPSPLPLLVSPPPLLAGPVPHAARVTPAATPPPSANRRRLLKGWSNFMGVPSPGRAARGTGRRAAARGEAPAFLHAVRGVARRLLPRARGRAGRPRPARGREGSAALPP